MTDVHCGLPFDVVTWVRGMTMTACKSACMLRKLSNNRQGVWQVRKAHVVKRAASMAASRSCLAAFAAWRGAVAELADAAHAQLQAAQAYYASSPRSPSLQGCGTKCPIRQPPGVCRARSGAVGGVCSPAGRTALCAPVRSSITAGLWNTVSDTSVCWCMQGALSRSGRHLQPCKARSAAHSCAQFHHCRAVGHSV